jgi:hypothetical protein
MRRALVAGRGALLNRAAAGLWSGHLPQSLCAALIVALMRRTPATGSTSRQLGHLAQAVAAAGARALCDRPAEAMRLISALRRQGAQPVLLIGDSHSRLYVHRAERAGRWLLPLHHVATGASARGLGNRESRSGHGQRIVRLVERATEAGFDAPVLLVFGQVDVEFVFTFKRLERDPPAALDDAAFVAFAETTAQAYAAFAARLQPAAQVILATIFPPALSDAAWRHGYLNAHIAQEHAAADFDTLGRRLSCVDIAGWPERTAQHRLFNDRLRSCARAHGLRILDAAGSLSSAAGVVSPDMLGRAAGRDHHLDVEAVRPTVTAKLWDLVDGPKDTDG